jgi:hypothetical protein
MTMSARATPPRLLLQEGHHLHTVGLELQLDVSAADPAAWAPGQAWLGGTLRPSPQALAAAWNSSRANSSTNSSAGGADTAALERLRAFYLPSPSAQAAATVAQTLAGTANTAAAAAAHSLLQHSIPVIAVNTMMLHTLHMHWVHLGLVVLHIPATALLHTMLAAAANR